jgi:transcriptional regulator with XRE-family HTH domain
MNNQKGARAYTSKTIASALSKVSPEEQKRTENKMLLAAKIDDGRKTKGWSQTEFAEQMGKQPSEISKWLSGTHNFTSDTLWDIEEKLGIELISVKEKELRVVKVVEYKIVVSSPAQPRYAGLHESGISKLFHQQPSLA